MLKKASLIIIIAIIACMGTVYSAQAAIQNGGFEDSDFGPNNWTNEYGFPWNMNLDPANSHSGNNSVYNQILDDYTGWPSDSYWSQLYQDIPVSPGAPVSISGYVKQNFGANSETARAGVGIQFLNSSKASLGPAQTIEVDNTASDWTYLSKSATASSTAAYARLMVWMWAAKSDYPDTQDDLAYFDDISGGVIPEPSSLILLGSGILGMLGITRKRKAA